MKPPFQEENQTIRGVLRIVGFIFAPVGGIFILVGAIDFFSAFGGSHMPTKFWCLFVGMPLFGIGIASLKAGFLGKIGRYVASEAAPVATESVKYMAEELRPTVQQYAKDLKSEESLPAERMKHLDELRRGGFVTDAEYEAKRREILDEV